MTTKIPCRTSLTYIPKIGFVSKSRIMTFLFVFAIALIANVLPDLISSEAEANQAKLPTLSDKMVGYMKNVNKKLDFKTAYELADAIIAAKETYGIPVEIQLALVRHESRFEKYALGTDGELGFYQIMTRPHAGRVFRMLKTEEITTKNIYDPYTNSALGASILSECLKRKNRDMRRALSCYNGPKAPIQYATDILDMSKQIKQLI